MARIPPPPLDREVDRLRLKRVAMELSNRNGMAIETPPLSEKLLALVTEEDRRRLGRDVESLSKTRITANYPPDEAGRLSLGTAVLLGAYKSTEPPSKDREVCLAVIGPERRRDPQKLQIQLVDLIVPNQSHRWDQCRWLWTDEAVPERARWAVAKGESAEEQRAYESVQLLDQGRMEEALSLFGVSLSPDVRSLLGGEEISPPACCAKPDQSWTDLLIATLRESAPWLLPEAVLQEVERVNAWRAEKKGRPKRAPELKLVIFPGQFHARKVSLILTGDMDGKNPRMVIEATGSNARAHDTAWKRSLRVDLERYGISIS